MTTPPTPDELRNSANAARDLGPEGPPIILSAAAVEYLADALEELDRLRTEAEEFEEEWVCPECCSFDTDECPYLDDHSSRRCRECGYAGSPGEDFPTSRRIREERDQARRERDKIIDEIRSCESGLVTGHMFTALRKRAEALASREGSDRE